MIHNGYIRINSDEWEDAGVVYKVIEYFRRNPDSTAVELTLEHTYGQIVRRVVPYHWIEWVPDGDF